MSENDEEFHARNGDLQYIRKTVDGLRVSVDKVLDDHERRLRVLELRVWMAIGAGGALGWLASWLLTK